MSLAGILKQARGLKSWRVQGLNFSKNIQKFDIATTSHHQFSLELSRKFLNTTSNKSHMQSFMENTLTSKNSGV